VADDPNWGHTEGNFPGAGWTAFGHAVPEWYPAIRGDRRADWYDIARQVAIHGNRNGARLGVAIELVEATGDPAMIAAFERAREGAQAPTPPPPLRVDTPSTTPRPSQANPLSDRRKTIERIMKYMPRELLERAQWVVWKYEHRKAKRTKVPYQARSWVDRNTGELVRPKAKPDDSSTWRSFNAAVNEFLKGEAEGVMGIGYVFSAEDQFTGVDFDNCLIDGKVADWARPYLQALDPSYFERSPSGDGIKFWIKAPLVDETGKKLSGTRVSGFGPDGSGAVEMYPDTRFFTTTADVPDGIHRVIEDKAQEALDLYRTIKAKASADSEARRAAKGNGRPSKAPLPREQGNATSIDNDDELLTKARICKNGARFISLFDHGDLSGHDNDASKADFALIGMLGFWTGRDAPRIDRLFRRSALFRAKWNEPRGDGTYGSATIENALAGMKTFYVPGGSGTRSKASAPTSDRTGIPDIEVTHRWHEVVESVLPALAASPDLYRRGGKLVTVIQETDEVVHLTARTPMKGTVGTPKIIIESESNIGCRLSRCANFFRWKERGEDEPICVDLPPPQWLTKAISTRQYWPGVRPLISVMECPFPRPDGSIVETPGYDAATATLYMPSLDFPPIPTAPTKQDAQAAAARFLWYFREFPFASENDKIIVLVGALNVLARPAILTGVPGVAVNGNRAATGKGLLIDGMSIPATGRPAPTSTYPDDPAEAKKVKTAIALSAKPVVHFDNLEEGSSFGNGPLDSGMTALIADERLLGTNDRPDLPLRPAWFLSGNNIAPGADAHRRWLMINLITQLERPEERDDIEQKNLKDDLIANRPQIVVDLLTILRAHAAAGYPTGKNTAGKAWAPLGSFGDWDRVVRGAVWFATGRDCLVTQREAASNSPQRQQRYALLEGWRELQTALANVDGLTAAEAIAEACRWNGSTAYPVLHAALVARGKAGKMVSSTSLGAILRGMKNTTIGGLKLEEGGQRHKTTLWKVSGEPSNTPNTQEKTDSGLSERGTWGDGGHDSSLSTRDFDSHSDVMKTSHKDNAYYGVPDSCPPSPQVPLQVVAAFIDPSDPINSSDFTQ
jgi:putative DNA primase/helicase